MLIVLGSEAAYRYVNKRSTAKLDSKEIMTKNKDVKPWSVKDIKSAIEKGEQLLIFDNTVLDAKDFW